MAASRSVAPAVTVVRRGWFARNWKWFIPLSILLVVVVGGGLGVFLAFGTQIKLRFSAPYQETLAAMQASPEVKEAMGEPVTMVPWLPSGELNETRANLFFQAKGPKANGTVASTAAQTDGKWELSTLVVSLEDGPKINLTDAVRAHGSDNTPKYNPDHPAKTPARTDEKAPEVKLPDASEGINIELPGDAPSQSSPPNKKNEQK
ncbi:MAG TPA: cytochrome c oxidase assembly factor Coa1 family protein [Pirellulales bacterium]|jgi:hypothetical protein|nr:cytochrome c oxidase assembly factor Coa1 family protein [Pirellulales bacterium]